MRWSDYLQTRPLDERHALVNRVTVGYGTLAFMTRQLDRNGEMAEVAHAMDLAESNLDAAYRLLAVQPNRDVLPDARQHAAGQPWQTYLSGRPDGDGPSLLAYLQDVVHQAQVAGEVIGADGSVDEIVIHLRAALDHLKALRGRFGRQEL